MDKIKNEDSCQETLESGDPTKSSIIEGQIKVVNPWFEDEFDKLRRRIEEQQYRAEGLQHSIMVIEDDQGETYVKLQGARKEKLAAL